MAVTVFAHTCPVFVYIEDGKVTKVVVDDSSLSAPTAVVGKDDPMEGWVESDLRSPSDEELAMYESASDEPWPPWDWGWDG